MTTTSILLRNGTLLLHQPDDSVTASPNTDLLITGDTIAAIGTDLSNMPENTREIDCSGKIVSPGFVDTHHHLWQTQLKGRHADHSLTEYVASGEFFLPHTPRLPASLSPLAFPGDFQQI